MLVQRLGRYIRSTPARSHLWRQNRLAKVASPISTRNFSTGAPPLMIKRRKWPWVIVGAAALFGAWKWYTWHNYPESVAKILKKGLMAEINGAGYRKPDRKLALKYYLEALKEADELEMSPVSDEYTGIQLKIGEMYEHLGMAQQAAFVYMEVLSMYSIVLNSNKVSALNRDHMIKRDLMVAIMLGLVLKDPALSRKLLTAHLDIAANRAVETFDDTLPLGINTSLLLDFHDGRLPNLAAKVNSDNEGAWADFRYENFGLREMVTMSCMEEGDFWQAALFKYQTTLLMLSSGFEIGECLLSLTDVGSLACLQATKYECTHSDLTDPEVPNDEGVIPKPGLNKKGAAVPPGYISVSSLDMVKKHTDLTGVFLEMSDKFYTDVRHTIEGLRGSARRGLHVDDAYALAIYGQGVVALKKGDFDKASDLLHEAQIRAKGCNLEEIIERVDDEIVKLDKIRASGRPISDFAPSEIPEINVAFWKIDAFELRNKPEN